MNKIIDFIKRFKLKLIHIHHNNYSEINHDNSLIIELYFAKKSLEN